MKEILFVCQRNVGRNQIDKSNSQLYQNNIELACKIRDEIRIITENFKQYRIKI